MNNVEEIVKNDVNNIIQTHGLSSNEFKITVEIGSDYAPMQLVGSQVWVTVERNSVKKNMDCTLIIGLMSLKLT